MRKRIHLDTPEFDGLIQIRTRHRNGVLTLRTGILPFDPKKLSNNKLVTKVFVEESSLSGVD